MKKPKVDMSGTAQAQQAIADAQKAATNLSQNFAADLKNQNVANVIPGGGDAAVTPDSTSMRRKKQQGGLSSQLGINL